MPTFMYHVVNLLKIPLVNTLVSDLQETLIFILIFDVNLLYFTVQSSLHHIQSDLCRKRQIISSSPVFPHQGCRG